MPYAEIHVTIRNVDLQLRTHERLFSPRQVDAGTLAMLELVDFNVDDKVLDLGCGYGVVGILAAKLIGPERVVLLDSDPLAVEYARMNAELNGVGSVQVIESQGMAGLHEAGFSLILSNPPYHTDFAVAKHFIEKGFNRLSLGGSMFLVVKRRKWYENKMRSIFGGVQVHQTSSGYCVLAAQRRKTQWANTVDEGK